ncbi:MAG TPA: penicillin acylase family protein [Usitatibacter sp.]|nr:penicillin acylase family protein [Usitatibacter sp.]
MRIARRVFGGLLVLVIAASAAAWLYLRESLPRLDGALHAARLKAEVEVLRDADGIPHILAKNEDDAWYAMGYVHAQDRLWQMEFQRRVAQGRLSEFLGERAYDTDRLMRTLGMARMAERIVARLDRETVAHLEAYAAGVNAFIDADAVLPVEFQVFRIKPERWKPADTMGWLLVMAWDLSSNWRAELARMRFILKMGPERANEIIPPYPGDTALPLPDFRAMYAEVEPAARALLAASPSTEHAVGSNSWAVSGARSVTGKPILANDPHLGLQAPSLWYLAHISMPAGNVVGGTLPGVPFVVLGRTDQVAWTFTTTNSDTQDLFIEKLAPGDPSSYLSPTGAAKFETREESIRVGSEVRRITVRTTRHGPVISDAVKTAGDAAPKGHVLALAWTALTEDNVVARAGFALNRARSIADLHAAMREFTAPHQNVVFADRAGHIGFVAPARLPVRGPGDIMGRVPVPGWELKYDWRGFLPYEEMPAVADPPSGVIVTANNKITPPGYKPFISVDWFPPYRADRIEELLALEPKHTLSTFARMQADTNSRLARELLAVALAAKPSTPAGLETQALLKGWEGDMRIDSPAPLVFSAWYRELTRLVYADELDEMFKDSWDLRAAFMIRVMKGDYAKWCDNVRTPAVETCGEQSARAFDVAAEYLAKHHGERSTWRWGAVHAAAGDHRPFSFVPVVSQFFTVAPETPGDSFTVDVGHFFIRDEARPFANRHAASLRAIYDLSDLDKSLFMHSTGQSGNFMSPWYSNMAERWAKVDYVTIPTDRNLFRTVHRLVLKP